MAKVIEGQLSAAGFRFGIVAARFNSFITSHLLEGARDTIIRHGGSENEITIVHVPGSFEIPLVCKKLAESGQVDAIVAVGAVIRGSTTHYDHVCSESIKGIAHVSMETGVPVLLGIITTESIEQAIERSGTKAGNKGAEAAMAAIEMVQVLKHLRTGSKQLKVSAV